MNKRQHRMHRIVSRLIDYWTSYPNQSGYTKYQDKTLIDDALYGLGISIDKKYRFGSGYREFKKVLREHLKEDETALPELYVHGHGPATIEEVITGGKRKTSQY